MDVIDNTEAFFNRINKDIDSGKILMSQEKGVETYYSQWSAAKYPDEEEIFHILKFNFVDKGIESFFFAGNIYKIKFIQAPSRGGMGQQPDKIKVKRLKLRKHQEKLPKSK